jgi:hypothetical protein
MQIKLSEKEIQSRSWEPEMLERANELFRVHGFLSIGNLFSPEFIEGLYTHYFSQLSISEDGTEIHNAAQVGHRRFLVPIEFKKPFNVPDIYANPFLLQLFDRLLGSSYRLSSLGSITALPGALDQHIHDDHRPLFAELQELGAMMPPFGITVGISLVDIDLSNGPTVIWSGSHLMHPIDLKMDSYSKFILQGKRGAGHLWDYRTFHAGGANRSTNQRPLLYLTYLRNWFQDSVNPDELRISDEEFGALEPEVQELINPRRSKFKY